jgi:hypothetical protein
MTLPDPMPTWAELARRRRELEAQEREAMKAALVKIGFAIRESDPLPGGAWQIVVTPVFQPEGDSEAGVEEAGPSRDAAPLPLAVPVPEVAARAGGEPLDTHAQRGGSPAGELSAEGMLSELPPLLAPVDLPDLPPMPPAAALPELPVFPPPSAGREGEAGLVPALPPLPEIVVPDAAMEAVPQAEPGRPEASVAGADLDEVSTGGLMDLVSRGTEDLRVSVGAPRDNPLRRMAEDPTARARRLARTLVSDVIEYRRSDFEKARRRGPAALAAAFSKDLEKSRQNYRGQVDPAVPGRDEIFDEALAELMG